MATKELRSTLKALQSSHALVKFNFHNSDLAKVSQKLKKIFLKDIEVIFLEGCIPLHLQYNSDNISVKDHTLSNMVEVV